MGAKPGGDSRHVQMFYGYLHCEIFELFVGQHRRIVPVQIQKNERGHHAGAFITVHEGVISDNAAQQNCGFFVDFRI